MTAPVALTHRAEGDAIAVVSQALHCLNHLQGVVTTRQFLAHVQSLAAQLPDAQYAINLCQNRYLFMVSFCAALLREQTNLLPPNKNLATQHKLSSRYNGCYVLHDGQIELEPTIAELNIQSLILSDRSDWNIPLVPANHLAAISFTSGSTGDSKPNLKHWGSLHVSSKINFEHMLRDIDTPIHQLATVPAQHMWGFETSVFLPLHHNVCVHDAKPLYPADVAEVLASLPTPRCLVTTPIHLRSLIGADLKLPQVAVVLCATSPLAKPLAVTSERQFGAELREVYGCSEVGSMAVRHTAHDDAWQLFDGIQLHRKDQHYIASGHHLAEVVVLQDNIEMLSDSSFTLQGRSEDMIDIAGKRGSLLEVNQVLHNFHGLDDGVIFQPPSAGSAAAITRLAAIVSLKPDSSKAMLREYLAQHLDSAFVPRPIYLVATLGREDNGKLPRAKVMDLYQQLSASAC